MSVCAKCGKPVPIGVIICADCLLKITGVYGQEADASDATEDADNEELSTDGTRRG